jgi:hypothetical protein
MSGPIHDSKTRGALRSRTIRTGEGQVAGHVLDPAAPERRFVVELLLDGYPAALGRADHYDPDLAREGFGDGCYGFVFSVAPPALQTARRIEIRLANSGEIVGAPLLVKTLRQEEATRLPGEARWESGLRFTGWVAGDPARAPRVRALVDGPGDALDPCRGGRRRARLSPLRPASACAFRRWPRSCGDHRQ